MRFSSFFLLCLFILTFAACGGEDAPSIDNEAHPIVGNWRATSGNQSGTSTTSFAGTNLELDFTSKLVTPTTYGLTLTANPNKVTSMGTANVETTYTLDGTPTTFAVPVPLPVQAGDWEVTGNKLRLTSPGKDPYEIDIVTLNETTLTLSGTNRTTIKQAGVSATTLSDFTYTYERQ